MRIPMIRVHPAGFFEAVIPDRSQLFAYRLIVADSAGAEFELEDPYRFPPLLTPFDLHLFGEGTLTYAYEKLGAHFRTVDGVRGVNFAVWAPNAERVSVIGTFNGWDNRAHPMHRTARRRRLGTLHPQPGRRRALQIRGQITLSRL